MIKGLDKFDSTTAAGLLARAALSLSYLDYEPEKQIVDGENEIRLRLIRAAREELNVREDDNSPETIERIADLLDSESDRLVKPPDTASALARLAERGDLPSDLYEIEIIQNIVETHGKGFALERELIETTIRAPTSEQHYGPPRRPQEPAMVSLFARPFTTKWPHKDFTMLVVGQRVEFRLVVHQAWRLYPSIINMAGAKNLVGLLKRFADVYGAQINVGGEKGKFILISDSAAIPQTINLEFRPGVKETITVSRFTQRDPTTGIEKAALVLAVNLNKYLSTLERMAVKREEILDEFVPAPKAKF